MTISLGASLKAAVSSVLGAGNSPSKVQDAFDSKLFYTIKPGNWFKTFPYFFEIRETEGENQSEVNIRFFLPIPPQSMTLQDMSTSEAHATIGGVVEETSAPVFSTITLVGTTGLSSNDINLDGLSSDSTLNVAFRKYIDDVTGRDNPIKKLIGGLIDEATGAVNSIVNGEAELPYGNAPSAVNTPKDDVKVKSLGATTSNAKPKKDIWDKVVSPGNLNPFPQSSGDLVTPFSNGFAWSHALKQFFLIYQREKSKNPNLSLHFVDGKSNTQYRCVPRSVQFQKSAKDPYLEFYNIVLKCWNIDDADGNPGISAVDRFGPNGDLQDVYTATITSRITQIGRVINRFSRPSSIAGALVKTSTSSIL